MNFHKKRGSGEHRRIAEVAPHKSEIGESSKKIQVRSKYPNFVVGRPPYSKPEGPAITSVKYHPKEDIHVLTQSKIASEKPSVRFQSESVKKVTTTTAATVGSTSAAPPLSPKSLEQTNSNGKKKKINYNYHPIIEFFVSDLTNTTGEQYSKPYSAALTSQDWTPLVGRSRA